MAEPQAVETEQECTEAYQNPKCPYITQINQNTQVSLQTHCGLIALLGEDMTGLNGGVVRTLFDKIEKLSRSQQVQNSWIRNLRPVATAAFGVVLTAVVEYWLLKGF